MAWHARLVRTRSAAASLVSAGYVRINGAYRRASRVVRTGDVITVALDRSVRVVKVRGFADLEVARCIAEEAKLSGDEAAIGLELLAPSMSGSWALKF